jgi:hypothetical protein
LGVDEPIRASVLIATPPCHNANVSVVRQQHPEPTRVRLDDPSEQRTPWRRAHAHATSVSEARPHATAAEGRSIGKRRDARGSRQLPSRSGRPGCPLAARLAAAGEEPGA